MEPHARYEIIDTIATGDFATVYRARDRELGREVAIKQIHQQFLGDPRQLDRYWGEAQLLASLQHPNIVTIYDLVRPRGWLVLELMRGSLRRSPESKPIDLNLLRMVLISNLNALQFLHANGVIHGDVKPGNMLVDMQNRIKLGDFGLARRASGEEGSLLKGTTKYMAPELVSPEFGPVGPASDLYSLGFSAYELMCGAQFESLFPGLGSYGRDKQIAWMMWHSAPDRKLPEIARVLEGVPEDLARVIQRLVAKDQSQRYRTATEVLRDLRSRPVTIEEPPEQVNPEEEAAKIAAAKKNRIRRIGAIAAVVCSLLVSLTLLLPSPTPPVDQGPPKPVEGILRQSYVDEHKIALEMPDGTPKEITFTGETAVFVNDRPSLARDLQPGDHVLLKKYRNDAGRLITELRATRPDVGQGRVAAVKADQGEFTLAPDGEAPEKQLVIGVPRELKIRFNGRDTHDGKPVALADLRAGDRVVVHHVGDDSGGRRATELDALREVTFEGVVRGLDEVKGELTVAQGPEDKPEMVTWPFAPTCEVTINDRRILNERELKPADLRPGDKVKVTHDQRIVRVNAYRVLGQTGIIQKIHSATGTLDVLMDGATQPTTFTVGPKTAISLGGQTVALDELRDEDQVEITHDAPDARSPAALSIAALRPADPRRWAVLIGIQEYDDRTLGPLTHTVADAQLVRDRLVRRYRVPDDQALLLANESRVRLEQGIPDLLRRAGEGDNVIVYFAGHAFADTDGKVYLAPKDFDRKRPAVSGLALEWLVEQFEQCPAKEKLLLLDSTHAGEGPDLAGEPSAAEMLKSLKAPPGRSPLRTVTAVGSCSPNERGYVLPAKEHGLFAYCLAEGFSGKADKNRDNRLEPTELFSFLTEAMTSAGSEIAKTQTPVLILPDDRPPRLSEEAKTAIRRLAAQLGQDRIASVEVDKQYAETAKLSGEEPEPKLLYGLLLMKTKRTSEAQRQWEEIKVEHPDQVIALEAAAWLQFSKVPPRCEDGVDDLAELISRISKPSKPDGPYPPEVLGVFRWTGRLREYAESAAQGKASAANLAKLDAAVAAHGPAAEQPYQQGREETRAVLNKFDRAIEAATDKADTARLQIERRLVASYGMDFPYDSAVRQIVAGLDQ
jgi:serine/threonine-protein kinase